jgi:predicted nucleic acid-binding protein
MICFDTNLLIFGIQKRSSPEYIHEVDAASAYINSLADTEDILIPPVVVLEYLQGFSNPRQRSESYESLAERFFIPSFDAHAAKLAADIAVALGRMSAVCAATGLSRPEVRADIQVIATALANNAETIITHNLREYQHIITTAGLSGQIKAKWVSPVTPPLFPLTDNDSKDMLN